MAEKTYVVPEHVSRTIGREAQRNNILAARLVADIVKTTLGPKGMDKMLVDSTGNVIVTNDGVTILEEMEFDHPAAKLIVEMAKTQEREVGDGTTTVAMLAGALLEKAEELLDRRVHPTAIVKGYRIAVEQARKIINELTEEVTSESLLKQIAMTAMTGKGAESYREKFAELIVKAINQISEGNKLDLENIKIEKISSGSAEDSKLVEGIVIDKEVANSDMPRSIKEAQILLIDFPLEVRGPETETKVSISRPEEWKGFLDSEEAFLKDISEKVINSGAKVVFCQKGIDDIVQYYLAKAGILAVRRVPRSDMEKLSKATSGKIVANIREITREVLGYAKDVSEIKKGDNAMTYVSGCKNPRAVSILLHGSTSHVLDELERAFHDGLGVVASAVRETKIVSGGGAVEIELSRRLIEFSRTLSGREQLAVEAFAKALETIPEALAENAGLDPIEIITELKKRHEAGQKRDGLNLLSDKIEDCLKAGIIEPLKVKTQALSSATEVATMILRIDDVLVASRTSQPSMPDLE